MNSKHLSSQFDAELSAVSSRIMELGGLVESQIATAIAALEEFDATRCASVIERENLVNRMEVDIDQALTTVIARRQPTARDLRLLVAFSRTTANLERVGDEAFKIARMVQSIITAGMMHSLPAPQLRTAATLAAQLIRQALDAMARLDVTAAVTILHEDDRIDAEFDTFVRKLVTCMTEDPRTISAGLDLLFIAKALERIGDHAKNIAEFVIYIVKGADVRHTSRDSIDQAIS